MEVDQPKESTIQTKSDQILKMKTERDPHFPQS